MRAAKDRLLSVPWIYDRVRPLFIGFIDHARLARFCDAGPADRVFDLGCGTAVLAEYLDCARYLGVDVDEAALARARRLAPPRAEFLAGDRWDEALRALDPTLVLMIGLVHHVSDETFRSIVERIRASSRARPRLVAFEATYLPGRPVSNLLSLLDRGRYVRRPAEYERLFAANGLRVARSEVFVTQLRLAHYLAYQLAFE